MNNAIVYSQQFPEKSLDWLYSFEAKVLGQPINTSGNWSLTLYDYSQTTTVKRIGGPGGRLKVRVEIDKIGDLKMHISDLLGGRKGKEIDYSSKHNEEANYLFYFSNGKYCRLFSQQCLAAWLSFH